MDEQPLAQVERDGGGLVCEAGLEAEERADGRGGAVAEGGGDGEEGLRRDRERRGVEPLDAVDDGGRVVVRSGFGERHRHADVEVLELQRGDHLRRQPQASELHATVPAGAFVLPRDVEEREERFAVPEGFAQGAFGFGGALGGGDDELARGAGVEGGDAVVRVGEVEAGEGDGDAVRCAGVDCARVGCGRDVWEGVGGVVWRPEFDGYGKRAWPGVAEVEEEQTLGG